MTGATASSAQHIHGWAVDTKTRRAAVHVPATHTDCAPHVGEQTAGASDATSMGASVEASAGLSRAASAIASARASVGPNGITPGATEFTVISGAKALASARVNMITPAFEEQ